MIRTTSTRSLCPTSVELHRAATFHVHAEGWRVVEVRDARQGADPAEGPPEARVVVSGSGLPGPCLLRVRERRGEEPRDVRARRDAASEHVVGVVRELPVRRVRGREWDAVLLQHAPAGGFDELLRRDGGLRGGEAATVLLGVAAGLAALHASGWARPGLTTGAIVFAADGCPALDVLDGVVPYGPEAAVADAEAFYSLAHSICLKVTDGSGMTLLSALEAGLRQGSWPSVEQAVLSAIGPEPVRLCDPAESREDPAGDTQSVVARRLPKRRLGDPWETALAFLDGDPARAVGQRLGAWLKRRPAVVVAGLVPLAAGLALVALLPSPSGTSPTSASRSPMGSPLPAAHPTRSSHATAPPTPKGEPSVRPASEGRPLVAGGTQSDDPVVAAGAVLDARHACYTARPVVEACLEDVLDGEPAFVAQETHALEAEGAGATRDYTGAGLSLVERWGDAALIAVVPDTMRTPHSEPASLLLVRGEAGWRLRAVFP